MNFPWFKRKGILFLPASTIGWFLLIGSLAYAVYIFRKIDSLSHSVSDTLMNFLLRLFFIFIVYSLTALLTSGKKTK